MSAHSYIYVTIFYFLNYLFFKKNFFIFFLKMMLTYHISHGKKFSTALYVPGRSGVKSGDKSLFSNYRPISLLPSLSKIFERVIFDQLLGYFTNNNLLCLDQFGFRPGHSTELAALRLVDHLITQMDRCKIPTNIYILIFPRHLIL